MRSRVLALAIACAGLTLTAASVKAQAISPSASTSASNGQSQAFVTKPSDPGDYRGWEAYLVGIVRQNSQGMTADHSYLYFIPSGNDSDGADARQRQSSNLKDTVARDVLPGNLLAIAGPDSRVTADVLINAFSGAPADSYKGVIVLFIGIIADKPRVFDALRASGATLRFIDMSDSVYPIRPLAAGVPTAHFIRPPPPPPPAPPAPPAPPCAMAIAGCAAKGTTMPYGMRHIAFESQQAPVYPGFESVYGIEGNTMLLVLVGAAGHPLDIKVDKSSGQRDLDRAAIAAAIHWQFYPEMKNGIAVDGYVRVPVNFNVGPEHDKRWPKNYVGAPFVLDEAPLSYATVNDALVAVAAQAHEAVYDTQRKQFQAYVLRDDQNATREIWYFTDVGSDRAMAIRYTFAGTPEQPSIKVSALCTSAEVCRNRMPWVMDGPYSVRAAGSAMRSGE